MGLLPRIFREFLQKVKIALFYREEMFSEEKKRDLETAYQMIHHMSKDPNSERNNQWIFVYCAPKVGSTSLVSSLKLFACEKYTVFHAHDDNPLHTLTNIDTITMLEFIHYSATEGKKVVVFDIYRTPLERKMSEYFEYICDLHFNVNETTLKAIPLSILMDRFNQVFRHIGNEDYFQQRYQVDSLIPAHFDGEKGWMEVEKDKVTFIKLRLQDSHRWESILGTILNIPIKIVKDYETEKKEIGDLYKQFKREYKIPLNYLEDIQKDPSFDFYHNEAERKLYMAKTTLMVDEPYYHEFTESQYQEYLKKQTTESKGLCIIWGHYKDEGCLCLVCKAKREIVKTRIMNGQELRKQDHVWHEESIHKLKEMKEHLKHKIKTLQQARNAANKRGAKATLGMPVGI